MRERSKKCSTVALGLTLLSVLAATALHPEVARSQAPVPPAARVVVPEELEGTPDEVRLLKHGRQVGEADTLAQRLLAEAEDQYGNESLEAADAVDVLVWAIYVRSDPERARSLAERALTIKESQLEPDDARLAPSLDNMARVSWVEGDTTGAEALVQRSLALRQAAFGPESAEAALSLRLLGQLRMGAARYAEARDLFEKAHGIQERTLGRNHLELLETTERLFYALGETQQWTRTDTVFTHLARRSYEIAEANLGPQQYRTIMALTGLGQMTGWTNPDQGQEILERALATSLAVLGPHHSWTGRCYGDLADFLISTRADPVAAYRVVRRALEDFPDHPLILLLAGGIYGEVGDEHEALEILNRAHRAIVNQYGSDSGSVAWALRMRADVLVALGSYTDAEQDYEQALAIIEALPRITGDARRSYPATMTALAGLKVRTGDEVEAKRLFEKAIAYQAGVSDWQGRMGERYTEYGLALSRMGEPEAALEQLQKAQAIYNEVIDPSHLAALENLNGIANAYLELGEYQKAKEAFASCLLLMQQELGSDHPTLAPTLTGLARVEQLEGHLDSARVHVERAIEIQERTYGDVHPGLAASLSLLAELELEQGDRQAALAAAVRAEEAGREHARLTARGLSERRALSYAGSRSSGLNCAMTAAAADGSPESVRAAWNAVMRSRGLVLDELAMRRRTLDVSQDEVADSLAQELTWARNRLANFAVRGSAPASESDGDSPESRGPTVEQLRSQYLEAVREKEELEEALAARSLTFRLEQERAAMGYQDVAAALPEDAAIVAFICHGVPAKGSSGELPLRYAAFVMRGGEPKAALVTLGDATAINTAVSSWREQVSHLAGEEASHRNAGEVLRRQIWDPVVAELDAVQRVFVVPDGALHLVNVAALPSGGGGYLVESGPIIHYLSAERDLAMAPEMDAFGEGLLALGNPLFDQRIGRTTAQPADVPANHRLTRATCGDFRTMHFDSLPATAQEVREVCAMWPGKNGKTQVFVGDKASEEAFKSSVQGHRVVHVATHGFFLGGECRSALEGDRGIQGLVAEEPTLPEIGENPLLMSGLALAGANRREDAGPEEEDGILTAEEIAALDLSGVEWAVLSACETGVGEVREGEGVFGLRRAFQVAGAKTLIMSLWSVEDEATREWMKELYEARLVDGLDTAESVRQASLEMLRERRANGENTHPFYWGAFVAAGDWR